MPERIASRRSVFSPSMSIVMLSTGGPPMWSVSGGMLHSLWAIFSTLVTAARIRTLPSCA